MNVQWADAGNYTVVVSNQYGCVTSLVAELTVATVRYVDVNSATPSPPYTNWATAATNIQNAVDAAGAGDAIVVTNGTYGPVSVTKPVALRSVNGPGLTLINGAGAARCVYLTTGASLSEFTLTNGWAYYGGGVYCGSASATVFNCVLTGNWAWSGGGAYGGTLHYCTLSGNLASSDFMGTGGYGGGASYSTLNHCTLSTNHAQDDIWGNGGYGGGAYGSLLNHCTLSGNGVGGLANINSYGGGAYGGTLNNCLLTGNRAEYAVAGAASATLNHSTLVGNTAPTFFGGVLDCALNNCIVYFNPSSLGGDQNSNYGGQSTLNYCCTTPQPGSGVGNITNAPLFVSQSSGNLRLQVDSPCINAGTNYYVPGSTDLDDRLRVVGGTVDMGAYEFQSPASVISYAWLQQYGLSTDGSADFTDPDNDLLNTWQEWRCRTDPTNALSVLRLLSPSPAFSDVSVTWQSVAGVKYFLERSTNLSATPRFTPLATNLPGQPGTTTFTDTNAVGPLPRFYRVGVPAP